ncbi:MAG: hypothetical protein IPL05_05440 [Betaproteobacteria bacterium]|nr:hypothetical protein [Betaproteobacteria bacterium]
MQVDLRQATQAVRTRLGHQDRPTVEWFGGTPVRSARLAFANQGINADGVSKRTEKCGGNISAAEQENIFAHIGIAAEQSGEG